MACCIALAGNVGLGWLWRRKASLQHWRDICCCSPWAHFKIVPLLSPYGLSMCFCQWTRATLAAHYKLPFKTLLRSRRSCCRKKKMWNSVRTSLSTYLLEQEEEDKYTYRAPVPSHRCSLWDLHRRNRSITLHGWALRSLLPSHAHGPSCQADQASTYCRQTTGGDHTLDLQYVIYESAGR